MTIYREGKAVTREEARTQYADLEGVGQKIVDYTIHGGLGCFFMPDYICPPF
jgi:hypothetical protein